MDYGYYPAQPPAYQFAAYPPTPAQSYDHADAQPAPESQELYHPTSAYPGFEPQYPYAPDAFLAQQQQQQQSPHHPRPHPHSHHSQPPQTTQEHSPPLSDPHASAISLPSVEPPGAVVPPPPTSNGETDAVDMNGGAGAMEPNGNRSSSEDKETMTPAQSRRKAQNRAAQRAFRERKERHVKDLESKLNSLSAHSSTLLTDNERLKRELQKLATQNEILRATTGAVGPPGSADANGNGSGARSPSPVPGPQTYSPTDFQAAVGVDPDLHPLSFEHFDGAAGQRLLAAGATWDLIQSDERFRRGQLDVADVCRRLKGRAACDGRGPAFKEAEVLKAIEESAIAGSDELI